MDVKDWNNVNNIGIYSGNNALNTPVDDEWITGIVLADNYNTQFLKIIAFSTTHVYIRSGSIRKWRNWIQIF